MRIDLRILGQPGEPGTLNGKEAKLFLIYSLMKQVLESPNNSTIINDVIENNSQTNAANVDYNPVSHRDSEIHVEQHGNLGRHEVSKIEDRVQCQVCFQYQKTRRDMLDLRECATSHYRRGQAASRATNQQSIHHVRSWNSRFSIQEYSKCRSYGHSAESQKLKKARSYLDSVEDEQHQVRMHEQGYTQSDKKKLTE